MKTYNQKANAVRAMNTHSQKVQAYVLSAEIHPVGSEYGVRFVMKSDTPKDILEIICKFDVIIKQEEPVKVEPPKTKGLKIQKDRIEKNGIKRPSTGGKCAQLWELFDSMYAERGIVPTPKPSKERSSELGLDPTTTQVQLYRWREFMGFKGK